MSILAPSVTNHSTKTLTREQFQNYHYSTVSRTGLILINKENIPIHAGYAKYDSKSRKPASYRININGINYPVHRVIWAIVHGSIGETEMIDHIDGNPFNNKLENLRIGTPALNARNSSKHCNNKTGYTGVSPYFKKQTNSYGFTATWVDEGKVRSKQFSSRKYGVTVAFKMAVDHRKAMIEQLNVKGYGYTERHGK